MKVINAEGTAVVDLPNSLAKMLIERDWSKTSASEYNAVLEDGLPDLTARSTNTDDTTDDEPVPMSYIPGVVDGVTMHKIKQLVSDGLVPFTLRRNAKLVKPSDVVAALKAGHA